MVAPTFIFIGLLIFGAHLFASIFSKKRIPDVLFLVVIGILLGPVFKIIDPKQIGMIGSVFSSLTLVFILFDGGVDMKIDDLRKYWKGMVEVTLFSFILTMVVVSGAGKFLGLPWGTSLMMGAMLGGTAAAIVIPLVKQMKISEYARTILSLESAISAVLSMVVALAFMESYKRGSMSVSSLLGTVFSSFLMALILGVVGGIIWATLLDRVRKLQNSMFLTPAFLFVLYGIAEWLGYSGAIAVLAFGIVLGNTEYFSFSFFNKINSKHKMLPLEDKERSFLKELVFVFKTFFFVYIGVCIPFDNLNYLLYGLIITVIIYLARHILIFFFVGKENTMNDRRIVSMMAPKGLTSAVLASMPLQINAAAKAEIIPGAEMVMSITYSVIFFSIILTSLLVLCSRKALIDESLPYYDEDNKEVYDYE